MITIGFSTRNNNESFINYLKDSCGLKNIEIIQKINNGEKSLTKVYNEILSESKNDIVVFCHDDIFFDTKNWGKKIIKNFEKTDYGILGVAGTTHMHESGMWWRERKKMIGIVNHEHEGKKWESKYCDSTGEEILDSIVVDGLFIAINKTKIKSNFDEDFNGFHFYDVSFCFNNFLKGVKIGVIFNVRITHKSIGMTNEEWEKNRILFEEKFKESLPKKIPFDEKRKMKVLICCLFFKTFTGSELYVYELAKNLIKNNCDVTVMSQIGGPLTDMAKRQGIKVIDFDNPPGFKKGDGVWGFRVDGKMQPSEIGKVYRISETPFDVIHIQHKPVAERIVNLYPDVEKVYSIHSEVIELENPIKDSTIKKYIAIRPEIKDYIVNEFDIPEDLVEIIYNPVDNEKFKPKNTKQENSILFVGTIDYLRKSTIYYLIEYCKNNNKELWLVGEDKSNYLGDILKNTHVKYYKPTWNVETYIEKCSETAGIQLGRTTIEGWLCNKPGWIFKVDSEGNILSNDLHYPPQDIEKYYSSNVAKQIKKIYQSIL